jgi:hypothetical protein
MNGSPHASRIVFGSPRSGRRRTDDLGGIGNAPRTPAAFLAKKPGWFRCLDGIRRLWKSHRGYAECSDRLDGVDRHGGTGGFKSTALSECAAFSECAAGHGGLGRLWGSVDAEGRDYVENSGGRARAYALGGIRTSRRAFVCGIVALVSSVFGMAPFSWAEEEVEAGLKIQHETELNSPDWIFGVRSENPQGEKMRNGKTSAEDRQRTDVGIGEVIELTLEELKTGYKGFLEDVQWEIVEGDAYFGTDKPADDNINQKTWVETHKVKLKILVDGDSAPSQTVRVKVKTKPIDSRTNPARRRGFTAYAILDFDRKRPTGKATSFHDAKQWKDGFWDKDTDLSAINAARQLIGAWTILNVFPLPTSVNFGGPAEGGVKVLELDGNPDGTGEYAGKTIPVVCVPYSNFYLQLSNEHKTNKYYGNIDKSGFFIDNVGYYGKLKKEIDSFSFFQPDHYWEWQCNWYYADGFFAAQYNMDPTDSFANGEWAISYNERQKFKVFGYRSNHWDVKVEKFGSSVRRSRTGNTFTQTRVHGWMPWGGSDPNSAPPAVKEEKSPSYGYKERGPSDKDEDENEDGNGKSK